MNLVIAGACALGTLALACTAAAQPPPPPPSGEICLTNACMETAKIGQPKTVKEAIAAGDPAAARKLGGSPGEVAEAMKGYSDKTLAEHGLGPESAPARELARNLDLSDGSRLAFSGQEGQETRLRLVTPNGPGEPVVTTVVTGLDRISPDGSVRSVLLMSDGKIFQGGGPR